MKIPNPYIATLSKNSNGLSDSYIQNGVYKFLGCSILNVNMSLGFNGQPSSANITLVEDTDNGDSFTEIDIPSLVSISLPQGGVGKSIFYPDGYPLHQIGFSGNNVPFYFSGICTNWSVTDKNIGGRTISVTISDPRDMFSGVQCLLSGFSLSHNIGTGNPRFGSVDNVIDIFGYHNYGYESDKNEYGMPWSKILEVLNNTRIKVNGINFEFLFTDDAFNNTPSFYRINEEVIDLMSIIQKVCDDGGSDFICICRKMSSDTALVQFKGIRRSNMNPLKLQEINNFVNSRRDIVSNVRRGKEYRNEPTSNIVVGGMRNSNYVAYPSSYNRSMHLNSSDEEDYNAFPSDIKVRLFGGTGQIFVADESGNAVEERNKNFDVESGAIFPFWGFTSDDSAYPLIEPFLFLDHLVFDKNNNKYGNLTSKIPLCKISVKNFEVRKVDHRDVFIDGDGDSDERPFAYLEEYRLNIPTRLEGYVRGLPLNTEVLRAAINTDSYLSFFNIYRIHYPDIATSLGFPGANFKTLKSWVSRSIDEGKTPDLKKINPTSFLFDFSNIDGLKDELSPDEKGRISKSNSSLTSIGNKVAITANLNIKYLKLIFEYVKQYAIDNMGKKFLVCLPKSFIMNRIWDGKSVPTRPDLPEIEYVVDEKGYWEDVPSEFDGVANDEVASDNEYQIRRKFMAEDGRFYAMAVMNWTPEGNINFNSNGYNQAMFQDIPSSEYRPNRIAENNPERIYISCSVSQLRKRPDLALVEIPQSVSFDPTDSKEEYRREDDLMDDEFIATKGGLVKYLWYFIKRDDDMRNAIKQAAAANGENYIRYSTEVVQSWAELLSTIFSQSFRYSNSTEKVMDLDAIVIPLTSRWVSYGPWYATNKEARGMVKVEVDQELVPWNFSRSQPWNANLDAAGFERLSRTISDVEYLDTASIRVEGLPEIGPAHNLGYNNNLTGISIDFSVGGVSTTYEFSTYYARSGAYRKSDFDNISRSRIDLREKLPDIQNMNLLHSIIYGTNRFRE